MAKSAIAPRATRPINSLFAPQPDGTGSVSWTELRSRLWQSEWDVFEANIVAYDAQQFT